MNGWNKAIAEVSWQGVLPALKGLPSPSCTCLIILHANSILFLKTPCHRGLQLETGVSCMTQPGIDPGSTAPRSAKALCSFWPRQMIHLLCVVVKLVITSTARSIRLYRANEFKADHTKYE